MKCSLRCLDLGRRGKRSPRGRDVDARCACGEVSTNWVRDVKSSGAGGFGGWAGAGCWGGGGGEAKTQPPAVSTAPASHLSRPRPPPRQVLPPPCSSPALLQQLPGSCLVIIALRVCFGPERQCALPGRPRAPPGAGFGWGLPGRSRRSFPLQRCSQEGLGPLRVGSPFPCPSPHRFPCLLAGPGTPLLLQCARQTLLGGAGGTRRGRL